MASDVSEWHSMGVVANPTFAESRSCGFQLFTGQLFLKSLFSNPSLSVILCFVLVTLFAINVFCFHLRDSRTHCARIVLDFFRPSSQFGIRHLRRAGLFHRPLGVRL